MTVGAVTLFLVGGRVRVPGFDPQLFRSMGDGDATQRFALLAIGIAPFVAAFLFVELSAAVLPRLRALRGGTAGDRLPLTAAAVVLGAALGAWQSWALARYFQSLRGLLGFPAIDPGLGPALEAAGALWLASLVLGGAAIAVSRFGLGNGLAVLLGAAAAESAIRTVWLAVARPRESWTDTSLLLGLALVVVVPLVAAQLRKQGEKAGPAIPVPTCGLVVVLGPILALDFIERLSGWIPRLEPFAKALAVESWWGTAGDLAFTAGLALLLSRLFCPPRRVLGAFARARPGRTDDGAVRLALAVAERRSLVLVMAVAIAPAVAVLLEVPVAIGTSFLFDVAVAVAVVLDLWAEAGARAGGGVLVAAWKAQEVFAVAPAVQALADAGIPAAARGGHFRALFHLFAPFAPIEILVSPERAKEAEAVCERVVLPPAEATGAGPGNW